MPPGRVPLAVSIVVGVARTSCLSAIRGFKANSEATMTLASGGQPIVIPMDASGRVAMEGGKVAVLGGPDRQEVVVAGTTASGEPVEFRLTVPAI